MQIVDATVRFILPSSSSLHVCQKRNPPGSEVKGRRSPELKSKRRLLRWLFPVCLPFPVSVVPFPDDGFT